MDNQEDLKRNYTEFLKVLVVLSLSFEEQKKLYGSGNLGDELVIDFESYYVLKKESYVKAGFLKKEEVSIIDKLDEFIEWKTDEADNSFWLNTRHSDWDKIRALAKDALVKLGLEKLEINTSYSIRNDYPVIIEHIANKLNL